MESWTGTLDGGGIYDCIQGERAHTYSYNSNMATDKHTDVSISSLSNEAPSIFSKDTRLSILAYVDPSRIPFFYYTGNVHEVEPLTDTSLATLHEFFTDCDDEVMDYLLSQSQPFQCPRAILLSADCADLSTKSISRPSHLLLYGMLQRVNQSARLPTPPMSSSPFYQGEADDQDAPSFVLRTYASVLDCNIFPAAKFRQRQFADVDSPTFFPDAAQMQKKDRITSLFDGANDKKKNRRQSRDGRFDHNAMRPTPPPRQQTPQISESRQHSVAPAVPWPASRRASQPQSRLAESQISQSTESQDTPVARDSTPTRTMTPPEIKDSNQKLLIRTICTSLRVWGFRRSKTKDFDDEVLPDDLQLNAKAEDEQFKEMYNIVYKTATFAARRCVKEESGIVLTKERATALVDRIIEMFMAEEEWARGEMGS